MTSLQNYLLLAFSIFLILKGYNQISDLTQLLRTGGSGTWWHVARGAYLLAVAVALRDATQSFTRRRYRRRWRWLRCRGFYPPHGVTDQYPYRLPRLTHSSTRCPRWRPSFSSPRKGGVRVVSCSPTVRCTVTSNGYVLAVTYGSRKIQSSHSMGWCYGRKAVGVSLSRRVVWGSISLCTILGKHPRWSAGIANSPDQRTIALLFAPHVHDLSNGLPSLLVTGCTWPGLDEIVETCSLISS